MVQTSDGFLPVGDRYNQCVRQTETAAPTPQCALHGHRRARLLETIQRAAAAPGAKRANSSAGDAAVSTAMEFAHPQMPAPNSLSPTGSETDGCRSTAITPQAATGAGGSEPVVAQLVDAPKAPKVPISAAMFLLEQYPSEQAYLAQVQHACKEGFACRALTREKHVAVAKAYVANNFDEGDAIHARVARLKVNANNYDTGTFENSKNTVGGYNFTTRFFNHMMKLFYMLHCLDEAADVYAASRKRKLQDALEGDENHTGGEKDNITRLWAARERARTLELGTNAVMKAHIDYMNTCGDMQYICAIMIMNDALFDSKSPRYDLKSIVDIAICYSNVCNWFSYIETNKTCQVDFVEEGDQAAFSRIMERALDNKVIPHRIREEYKVYTSLEESDDPNKRVDASARVCNIRHTMRTRWNKFTEKFGVPPKEHSAQRAMTALVAPGRHRAALC